MAPGETFNLTGFNSAPSKSLSNEISSGATEAEDG